MPIAVLKPLLRRIRPEVSDDPLTLVYIRELRAYVAGMGKIDLAGRIDAQLAGWQALGTRQREAQPLLSTLLGYEVELVGTLGPVELWRSYWLIKEWFGRIATKKALIAHESLELAPLKDPPADTDTQRIAAFRADQISMLRYIYKAYAISCHRETVIGELKSWIMMRVLLDALLSLVVFLALYLVVDRFFEVTTPMHLSKNFLFALLLIGLVGYVGAAMSTIRRLQGLTEFNALDRDPFLELSALRRGRTGIRLGLMSGSVFAILLYIFFASGIASKIGLNAGIFPASSTLDERQVLAAQRGRELSTPDANRILAETQTSPGKLAGSSDVAEPATTPPAARRDPVIFKENERCYLYAGPSCGWVANLSGRLGFRYAADFFLMLLWAFVAGFAERLVPDVIDRTVRAATSAAKE